jgi:two-component system alkaline phosphatase synthesis response regulator PhoP
MDKESATFNELNNKFSELGMDTLLLQNKSELFTVLEQNNINVLLIHLHQAATDAIVLCQEIRSKSNLRQPFIIIYAEKSEDFVQITAFNSGADDFVVLPLKPFLIAARIKAMLRRQVITKNKIVKLTHKHNITIDYDRFKVVKNNKSISLTRKEFDLINLLYSNPNKVFSREEIAVQLWKDKEVAKQRTIDIHVRNIRKRVGKEAIKTLKGIGYCAP